MFFIVMLFNFSLVIVQKYTMEEDLEKLIA